MEKIYFEANGNAQNDPFLFYINEKRRGAAGEGEGEGYVEISRLTIITVLMAFRKVRHIPFSFLHIQSTIGQSNCHLVTFVEIKKKEEHVN